MNGKTNQAVSKIQENHRQEWQKSGVLDEIILLNVSTIEGEQTYEVLTYGIERQDRLNDGRLSSKDLKRYAHTTFGGWYCSGVSLVDFKLLQWGCFKPDQPRKSGNKIIKYEHPCNVQTEIFALKVTDKHWHKIAEKHQTAIKKDSCFWEWVSNTSLPVIITEGAKKTACLLSQDYISIALPGVNNAFRDGQLHPELQALCRKKREIILAFDQDSKWKAQLNVFHATVKLGEALEKLGCSVSTMVWDANDGKGIDDLVVKDKAKLEAAYKNRLSLEKYIEDHTPENQITQIVCKELYSDTDWICVDGTFYKWVGTHYQLQNTQEEKRRIGDFLNSYSVKKNNKICYPYANSESTNKCINWLEVLFGISPDKVAPPGINCLNGIVRINWIGFKPRIKLIPHTPDQYYLDEPTFNYDPNADQSSCLKLLEALDPSEKTIFLRTVAASQDLETVRRKHGRLVRALLCVGDGSNGKDALRECVSLLHRSSMTSVTLRDFVTYDAGRKFPLARLSRSRFNWSSENAHKDNLDKLQTLKQAITGEAISYEQKGKDETEFKPKSIFLFNCNELPKIQGHQSAFTTRYSILNFRKTFKVKANIEAGELQADPRFRYDPAFLRTEVMPAFLNLVLAELDSLMTEGIDYEPVEKAMNEARAESNHLYTACQDLGLVADKNSEVLLKDAWMALYGWYLENGYAEEENDKNGKVKKIWSTDVDQKDPLVKAPRTLLEGLKSVFGNSLKVKTATGNRAYIVGVKLSSIEKKLSSDLLSQKSNLPNSNGLQPFTDNDSSQNILPNSQNILPNSESFKTSPANGLNPVRQNNDLPNSEGNLPNYLLDLPNSEGNLPNYLLDLPNSEGWITFDQNKARLMIDQMVRLVDSREGVLGIRYPASGRYCFTWEDNVTDIALSQVAFFRKSDPNDDLNS